MTKPPVGSMISVMPLKNLWVILVAVALVCVTAVTRAENAAIPLASPNTTEIVRQMQQHNQARTDGLRQYKALRHYQVQYKGLTTLDAKMDVEVSYDALSGKSFHIVSQSGSGFLCDKVLKRAVESEREAGHDKGATALTEANYRFTLLGSEPVGGRPAYILNVEPLTESKFLYRGKIWVDAADYAVVKIDAEPAKNPSFWISRTVIQFTSGRNQGFWLPAQNRSETKVRVGGTAVLTIDYGTYDIVPVVSSPLYGGTGF
jgi:hypothetical protein